MKKNTEFRLMEAKPRHFVYIAFIVINVLLSILISYTFSQVIDQVAKTSSFQMIIRSLLFLLAAVLLNSFIATYFVNYKCLEVNLEESINNSKKILKLMLKSPLREYEKQEKGYFINLATSSGFTFADIYMQLNIELIGYILCVLIIIASVTFVDPLYGLVFLLYIPVFYFVVRKPSRSISSLQKVGLPKQDAFFSEIKKVVEEKRTININYADSYFLQRYGRIADQYLQFIKKFKLYETITNDLPGLMSNIAQVLILMLSVYLYFAEKTSLGNILFIYQVTSLYQTPLNKCFEIGIHYQVNTSHIERLKEFEDNSNRPDGFEEKYKEQPFLVQIDQGKFHTTAQKENMLFETGRVEIPKTGVTVIKGHNGSGKSILVNYLSSYFDADSFEGKIQLDSSLKDAAYLTYPTLLVNGTLQENLFGNAPDPEVFDMLNIDFSEKEINENVRNLSFGEQQKVNLLRVLSLSKQPVILDEPFTNLDQQTIKNLVHYIDAHKDQKAFLIICHSDEFDNIAKQICRIENSRLICLKK
ncbi:MAG TPA: hypothetical protein DCP49_07005 [Erysipelotrichaceae bacterium]|nr:hypothetical protein [Erysipelotrichaceae bacterium]